MARKAPPKSESETAESVGPTKTVSKAEAVRQALAQGLDELDDITGFLKSQFGIEMPRQQISTYKAQLKARAAKKGSKATGKPGRKPKAAVEGYLAPPSRKPTQGEGDLLAAMEAMKPLVEALGADKVHRLVDLLG